MKRVICLLLAVILVASALVSCGKGETDAAIDGSAVKLVTATDSLFSSYLYVIEDAGAVAELVELYNGVSYEPEPADDSLKSELMMDTLYMLSYHAEAISDGEISDSAASLWISPKGYVLIDADDTMEAHKLTSTFDPERLAELLKEYDSSMK